MSAAYSEGQEDKIITSPVNGGDLEKWSDINELRMVDGNLYSIDEKEERRYGLLYTGDHDNS